MPQRSMRLPAKTNVGTARSTQLCDPASSAEGSFWSEKLPSTSPTTPERPSAKTMGVERATSTTNVTTTAATIGLTRLLGAPAPRFSSPGDVDERNHAVDNHEDAADHRGEIEPPEVQHESRRKGLAVELG